MIVQNPGASDSAALADAEFDRLDELLSDLDNDDAMVVEELDGFLAAMACVPDPIDEADCIAMILGEEPAQRGDVSPAAMGNGGATYANGPGGAREAVAALVQRHARQVIMTLESGSYAPVLGYDEREQPDGSAWAVGFLRAVETHPDSWDALLDEKDFGDALEAIEALAATLDDDPGIRRPSRAERQALIDRMVGDVADIHEFFAPYRSSGTTPQALRVETVRRAQPKVGRNDPCPCGSGRKYKNCCAAS